MQQERASKRQQELLGFVSEFITEHGYGPSYREIMRAMDYKSVSTVAIHVENLIAKGYLARRDKSARSLEVVSQTATTNNVPMAETVEGHLITLFKAQPMSEDEKEIVSTVFERFGLQRVAMSLREDSKDETTA